ncbi:MAG: type II toxin-antitoxin system VapC family toxin [Acidimicrobiia bacterium]
MFLLDTNVISELRKAKTGRANGGVVEWVRQTPTSTTFLSAISLHELETGVLRAERSDPDKGAILRAWLEDDVRASFDRRVISVDGSVALAAAQFHVPDRAPLADALIGATALVHGLTMVTRDETDFRRFPDLEVINPWT